MRRLVWACLLCGCGLHSEGIAPDEESLRDTGTLVTTDTSIELDTGEPLIDSSIPDTGTPIDTTVVDSGADAFKPDTSMPDTAMPDTSMPDTSMPDIAPIDTAPETPGPSVTVSTVGAPSTDVDLTAGSPRDWAHWGHTMSDSWNHKIGGTWINKGTRTGASAFDSLVYQFSWTGGEPTVSVTNSKRGLQLDTVGNSVTFDVKGDPLTETTLDIWVSATGGSALLTGTLTDATTGSAASTIGAGVYRSTFKYRPATAAGRLTVNLKKTDAGGYTAFFAAVVR